MPQYDLSGVSVFLAMPVDRDVSPRTVVSLMETTDLLRHRGIDHEARLQIGGSLLEARDKAAYQFLDSGKAKFFTIDSDMIWQAADFLRLLALSTAMDVVCAAYTARRDPPLFYTNFRDQKIEANEHGCFPIESTGLGFTVVDRAIIAALSAGAEPIKYVDGQTVPSIFRFDKSDGWFRGEDMAFFDDIRALGHSIHLDPTVTLGHVGTKTYTASILDHLQQEPSP